MVSGSPKTRFLSLLFSFSLLITGCWDSREVEQLAIVTTLGIDCTSNDEWQVSARIMNPIPSSEKGGGTATGASSDVLLIGRGKTIGDAILNFGKRIPRVVFWGNLQNVIVGEQAAKRNISDIIQVHFRHPGGRPRTNLMITKGTAYEVLQAGPEISNNLSKEIFRLAEFTLERFGASCRSNYAEFAQGLICSDRDPVATEIKVLKPEETTHQDIKGPNKAVYLEGMAVFRGEQLAGWLNKDESLGYILATKKLNQGEINIPINTKNKNFTYMLGRTNYKITPHVEGDAISYTLKIKTMGVIVDSDKLPLSLESIHESEKQISDKLLGIVLQTIEKSKEYNSDFIGFSMMLHRHKPETWKKIKSQWRDSFQEATIEVIVEAKVNQTGRFGEKFKINKEQ